MRFIWPAPTASLLQGEPFEPRRVLIVIGDGNDNASTEDPCRKCWKWRNEIW